MFEGFPLICTVLLWPVGKEKENQVPSCKHSPNFKLQQLQHARKGCCRPWSLQGIVRPLATLYLDCLSPQPQPSSLDVSNWRLEFREKNRDFKSGVPCACCRQIRKPALRVDRIKPRWQRGSQLAPKAMDVYKDKPLTTSCGAFGFSLLEAEGQAPPLAS